LGGRKRKRLTGHKENTQEKAKPDWEEKTCNRKKRRALSKQTRKGERRRVANLN